MQIVTNAKRSWEELTFVPQRRDRRNPKRLRPINAVDTETINGLVWLIAEGNGAYDFPSSWLEVLRWFELCELYKSTNFAWNLDYDARAILALLNEGELLELAVTDRLVSPFYTVHYVPRKFLIIRYNGHRYEFFDLMQFFASSLENASTEYLGQHKIGLDSRRISNDEQFRKEHRDEIIAYCQRDASLTRQLGELNNVLYSSLGVHSNKWYSTGYIASQYFLNHGHIPRLHFTEPERYAYYSYAGGRFECFSRGYFENAYKYDITSAYPDVIRTLPDLDKGHWVRDTVVDYDADLIFARVRVAVPQHHVQPLYIKHKNLVVYPTVDYHHRILTKSELDLIDRYDLATIDVNEAWHFYADSKASPFASIEDMFKRRQELRREGDKRQLVLKVVMNSLYGKFIQITTEIVPEIKHKVGNIFLPCYASEITSRVRCRLVDTVLQNDLEPIAFFTDAILTEDKMNIPHSGLGAWSLEQVGELVLLGCGVYSFMSENKADTHLRGFTRLHKENLFELLAKNPDKSHISFTVERPISLGEYAHRNLASQGLHLNQWVNTIKELNINFDHKRKWADKWARCSQVFDRSHTSVPVQVTV